MAEPETTDKTPVAESETSSGHTPYVADGAVMPEFTWSAVLVGAVLGILFGASSLYLVLRVGMTVSASIPVAVISITLFRAFSHTFGVRRATILENNIVQTTGSAGESIAFGVGVTMPAVMILGFEMEITRVMVVSLLGGMLGILMMIPLRRAFIVKQHGVLKYPEGTACADVLVIGETGGSSAKTVFAGFGLAFAYTFLNSGMRLWKEIPSRTLGWLKGATPALESNPALLGVGYIIGTRIASVMVAGGLLASFVLVPAIRFFGENVEKPLYPGTIAIAAMDADQIRKAYVLYIGAGAVAAGRHDQPLPCPAADCRFDPRRDPRSARRRPRGGPGRQPHRSRHADLRRLVWFPGVGDGLVGVPRAGPAGRRRFLDRGDLQWSQPGGVGPNRALRVPLRDGLLAADGRNWLLLQSDFRHDDRHAAVDLPDLPGSRMDGRPASAHRFVDCRRGLHCLLQRRNHFPGPEDRLPRRGHAEVPAVGHPGGHAFFGLGHRSDAPAAEFSGYRLFAQEPSPVEPAVEYGRSRTDRGPGKGSRR